MKKLTLEKYDENKKSSKEDEKFNQLNGVVGDFEEDIFDEENNSEPVLVYVEKIGEDHSGVNSYYFMFSNTPEDVWGESWEIVPAANCGKIPPESSTYSLTKKLKSIIKFETSNDNTCFSMQDCIDGVLALAWEDIQDYDSYPEDGRLVFHFGETLREVDDKLATRHQLFSD